jgi:hypothetical protein
VKGKWKRNGQRLLGEVFCLRADMLPGYTTVVVVSKPDGG